MRFVAGRGAVAELLAGSNAAECHREDVAGLGAAAESHLEDIAGLGAAAKSHREDAADRRCGRAADRLGRSGKEAAGGGRCGRVGGAGEEWQWQGNATADWHGNAAGD